MSEKNKIVTSFGSDHHYSEAIERIMEKLLPPDFFEREEALSKFHSSLPLFSWTPLTEIPCKLSFFFCAKFRPGAFSFFSEMICRWLIPGKKMNSLVQFAIDFELPHVSDQKYMGGHVMVLLESEKELKVLQENLSLIETEIRLGIDSQQDANRILEIKGLSSDAKTALIQENIAWLVKARPQDFDLDIFSQLQHFLVLCKEEFKQVRSCRHLTRIVCMHYLFKKAYRHSHEAFPDKRYIGVKLMNVTLNGAKSSKRVLGVVLAFSFLRENEVFKEKHLLMAIQTLLPKAKGVAGSFFASEGKSEPARTFYFEVEKEEGDLFSIEEKIKLKEELPSLIQERIEEKMNPLFMPENEEEIMRHILTLSGQVKYVRDLPQTVINFHKQTHENLEFLVVIVRVVAPFFRTLQETFDSRKTSLKLIHNRRKIIGTLRKKYEKEASIVRVAVSKFPFIRQDHSIDLYKARGEVSVELTKILGDFRDYNGGIISKESQAFSELKVLLRDVSQEHTLLLENFFYSLSPPIMRSVLPPEPLKKLFFMLLEAESIPPHPHPQFLCKEEEDHFFLVLITPDLNCRELIQAAIGKLEIGSLQLTTCFVKCAEKECFGVIYRNHDPSKSLLLQMAIEDVINRLHA